MSTLENSGNILGNMIGTQINNYFENNYSKIPSLITELIKQLADIEEDMPKEEIDIIPYMPEEKIEYNNVIKYKDILLEYTKFYINCDNILNTLDNYNPGFKNKILRSIKIKYDKIIGELQLLYRGSEKIEIIRDNADTIIEKVESELRQRIDPNAFNLTQEDIDIGLLIIICYAFNQCKILDKPKRET